MEAGALKDRLLELCRRYQIKVGEVYHLGLGEKTEKGNAAFVGLGKTKRIIIGDTLYEKFPPEEVEAVFAHELGHQVHQDIWKGIGLSAVLLFLAFYITELIYENWLGALLQQTLHSAYGLLFFLITLSVVQIPLGFLQTLFSRQRERAADRFASETVKMPKELASALEKLTYQNWSYFKPAAIIEFFTYSHPAPWRRISKLKQT